MSGRGSLRLRLRRIIFDRVIKIFIQITFVQVKKRFDARRQSCVQIRFDAVCGIERYYEGLPCGSEGEGSALTGLEVVTRSR